MAEDGKKRRVSSQPEGWARNIPTSPTLIHKDRRKNHLGTKCPASELPLLQGDTPAGTLTCIDSLQLLKREEDRCKRPHPHRVLGPRAQQTSKEAVSALNTE